jgi:KDO2-lipid IV(A) lauroyltransferase
MNRLLYFILYALAFLLALLPFQTLYFVSNLLYFPVYYGLHHRRKLVRKNLTDAFSSRTPAEIHSLEKAFYHRFCDYFVETIKLLHISDSQIKERFVFKNTEVVQHFLDQGQPVLLLLGHYGNWEWVTSIMLHLKAGEHTIIGQVYRPLKNKVSDCFFLRLRKRFHSVGFTKNEVYRDIIRLQHTGKNWLIGFMSDQKPSLTHEYHRMQFLNQDTPVLTGTEKIARHTGAAVFYLDITCLKRGYYRGDIMLISNNPSEMPPFAITEKYMHLMEHTILRDPSAYLWTHNRWRKGK